jgi:hypothetical protein
MNDRNLSTKMLIPGMNDGHGAVSGQTGHENADVGPNDLKKCGQKRTGDNRTDRGARTNKSFDPKSACSWSHDPTTVTKVRVAVGYAS